MIPLELAKKYMDCVFKTGDLKTLKNILADQLQFTGPLDTFKSASDYLDALKADPPIDFEYKILKSYSNNSSACLIYQFTKPGVNTTMVQTFDIKEEKIENILLIFDATLFK